MSTSSSVAKAESTHPIIRVLLSWIVPILAIIAWQFVTSRGIVQARILPSATSVWDAARDLWQNGQLPKAIEVSFGRAAAGFLIGGTFGFLLGLINGLFTLSETLFDSSVQMLRNIPHLALIPLVILWFGIGEPAKIFLVSLGVFFPIYLNTFHGIRSIDPSLREMASAYGLRSWSLFWNVILPGALPSILIGIRYAMGLMWLTLIVAETIDADSGIGYITMNARDFMETNVVIMGILIYAVLGKLADVFVRILERILLPWQPAYRH